MPFSVRLVSSAKTDVEGIYRWLLARSAKGAFNWYSALSVRLEKLSDDASGCAAAREARRLNRNLRETYFKTRYGNRYRLIFTIVDSEVRILRVRALGQKLLRAGELPADE
ncbi:MAG: type II toxin-antitoxin system RelE/ParE family toxin [Planctomycetes bacterium]|nr:type II toxin-antitoxin system RelE/ParE family toxin [Planctomycetota bacterium]